ncbi:MAG: GspH/FimT family pseudopilin [Pseudomonadota bacterium]
MLECWQRADARHNRTAGFTILELMITIAVLGVMASFAVPSFIETIRLNRIVTNNNELITAMTLARSEAIKRGTRVTVCRSADAATCAGAGAWEDGWIVFQDGTNFGTVDGGEEIIRTWEAAGNGVTMRATGSFTNWVSFVGSGETRATPTNNGSFQVCGSNADPLQGRTINIGLIGYASTEKGVAACP